jgi:Flp pilus assembly protein TadG
VKIDGLAASYSPSSWATPINNRLAVPSYISIDVDYIGNASGGTAYIAVTAEQAPPSGTIKVWSNVLEDHEIATSAWGGYNGQEMFWIPVAWGLGTNGQVLNFTGPYPQTIGVQGTYTLNPTTDIFNNLNTSTWVQLTTGNKEVLNANFQDLPDTATGTYEEGSAAVEGNAVLGAWPNPSTGVFSVATQLPQGVTGTVDIFDVSGRTVGQLEAGSIQSMTIDEPGVYFLRLTTSAGEVVTSQMAVVR